MSYRIQVHPDAGTLLRTLEPHVVLRLGRALAELAEGISSGAPDAEELQVDNCVLRFVIDHAHRLLEVIQIELREPLSAAYADSHA